MVSSGSSAVPGPSAGVAGGRPGAVCVPGGGPSVGPGRRTLRSGRRVKSGPRPAGDGDRAARAAGPGRGKRRKGRTGGPTRACLTEGSTLRCQRGLSWAGWPRVPPYYPLLKKSGFQGLFSRAPGKSVRADKDARLQCRGPVKMSSGSASWHLGCHPCGYLSSAAWAAVPTSPGAAPCRQGLTGSRRGAASLALALWTSAFSG